MFEECWKGKNPPSKEQINNSIPLEYKKLTCLSSSVHLSEDFDIEITDITENMEPLERKGFMYHPKEQNSSSDKDILSNYNDNKDSPNDIIIERSKNKQRGKYLRACPDIQLIHRNSLRRHPNAFLRNASSLNNLEKIQSQDIYVKQTCPFDSLVEILTNAYIDNLAYRDQLNETADNFRFHAFIRSYMTKGVSASLYTERAQLLSTLFTISGNVLNCADNVNSLIKRIYINIEATQTFNILETCTVCRRSENVSLLEIVIVD